MLLFKRKKYKIQNDNGRKYITIAQHSDFETTESYKQLRTNIMFALSTTDYKVFSVSSSFMGEGKSSTSANLAIAMAQKGSRVLLIDCDLRKPAQHKIFKVSNKVGISALIGNMCTLDEALNKNVVQGLDLITSGELPPNPAEMVASEKMGTLLNSLSEKYDYVITDTPPINVVVDSLEMARYTSGIVLVARQGITPYEELRRAVNSAKMLNVNLLGVVLNGVENSKFSSRGSSKYGYGYGYGYGYDNNSKEQE
jgi:capsular exopolysaccharide synthesis family protein